MKILNLYAGIGGNRKLWGNEHEITAVELNPEIAKIYQDFFPNDKVIVTDAHQYLLEYYKEFDFIWSSPPCPSHSQFRYRCGYLGGWYDDKPLFPDMKLYEEIIFLQYYFKGDWVVENVESYYKPLIKPRFIQRHYFWSNFFIIDKKGIEKDDIRNREGLSQEEREKKYDFDLSNKKGVDKGKVLNNCVNSELGLHILNCMINKKQSTMGDFLSPKGESLIAINQNQKTIG